MSAEQLMILLISVSALSMKPGPGSIALVSRALNDGFFPAFAMAMGAIVVEMSYFVVTAKGFAFLQSNLIEAAVVLKIVGASYLIFFGFKALRDLKSGLWEGRSDRLSKRFLLQNFVTGALIALSNPLVILFYLGIIPIILDLEALVWADIMLATFIIFCVHFVLLSAQCLLASQLREMLKDYNVVRAINLVSALVFIGLGLFIALSIADLEQLAQGTLTLE